MLPVLNAAGFDMLRLIFKLIAAPLLLVLLAEALLRAGAWESQARPDSHAGVSILRKRALADPAFQHIDFVTLGSSRPEYGIDHEALAALAQRRGGVHANLTMPGSHWLTIDVLTDWLARQHPEIRGGIIALSVQDFLFAGNGSYELGIAYPFHRLADISAMRAHVPFEGDDPATWGTYSALLQYREDIQDFVRHPGQRREALRWWRERSAQELLARNAHRSETMCDFGLDKLAACDRVDAASGERAEGLKLQCQQLREGAKGRPDLTAMTRQAELPGFMRTTRDMVQTRLRGLHWSPPPVVVLMPVPRVWLDEVSPVGLHEWTLSILQPLVDAGTIRLIDATTALDDANGTDCTAFFDFYHQNDAGRDRLMTSLLPQLEALLYGDNAAHAAPAATKVTP